MNYSKDTLECHCPHESESASGQQSSSKRLAEFSETGESFTVRHENIVPLALSSSTRRKIVVNQESSRSRLNIAPWALFVVFFLFSHFLAVGGVWQVETLAGDGTGGFIDGDASSARFRGPRGVSITSDGSTALVCDGGNGAVRSIELATGSVATVVGSGSTLQVFGVLSDVSILSGDKTAVFVDTTYNMIYTFNFTSRQTSLLAGNWNSSRGFADGNGTDARFWRPTGVAAASDNTVLVTDTSNNRLRVVDVQTGEVSTKAGNGTAGFADGDSTSSMFSAPRGVAVNEARTFAVVADSGNYRVRKVDLTSGETSTLAGNGSVGFADGDGTAALFSHIGGISILPDESAVLVADSGRLRHINFISGAVRTLAGDGNTSFRMLDGVATAMNGSAIVVSDVEDNRLRVLRNCLTDPCAAPRYRNCVAEFSIGGSGNCECPDLPSHAQRGDDTGTVGNCTWSCVEGFYLGTNGGEAACLACPLNSNSSAGVGGIASCICTEEYFLDVNGEVCGLCASYPTPGCPADQYWQECTARSDASCLSCYPSLTSLQGSNGSSSCMCKEGFTGAAGGPCMACPIGTYKDMAGDAGCTSCPLNSTSALNSTNITDCICTAGNFGPPGDPCSACPTGTYKNSTGSHSCSNCPGNTTTVAEGGRTIQECVCASKFFGYAFNVEDQLQSLCSLPNSTNATAPSFCETPSKFWTPDMNSSVPYFRECSECPENSVSQPGSFELSECSCPSGYFGPNGQPCVACPENSNTTGPALTISDCLCHPGYYDYFPDGAVNANATNASFECRVCPVGTIKDNAGSGQCMGCQDIDFLSNSTGEGGDDCKCLPGAEPKPAGCQLCQPGYYKNATEDRACTPCERGYFQPSRGSRRCLICPENTYQNRFGNPRSQCAACKLCPPHSESPPGTDRRTLCQCSAGYTGRSGETCTACPAGTYKSLVGDSACLPCSNFGPHFDSARGSSSCACTPGYAPSIWNASICTPCEGGTSKGVLGSSNCTGCAAGKYSDAEEAATSCVDCPLNSTSAPRTVTASGCACDSGFEGQPPNSSCVACVPGFYKPWGGSTPCLPCEVDTYQPGNASLSCLACPGNTTSASSSESIHDCLCFPGYQPTMQVLVEQRNQSNSIWIENSSTWDTGECYRCAPGTYKDFFGREKCLPCTNNSKSSPDRLSCVCVDGYVEALSQEFACKRCEMYPVDGCPAGTYWKECDYLGNGLDAGCLPCPANTISPIGSLSIMDCTCEKGHIGVDGAACTPCDIGTYKGVIGTSGCVDCADGFFQDKQGSSACEICTPVELCPNGQFWVVCPKIRDGHCDICDDVLFRDDDHFTGPGVPNSPNTCPMACNEGYIEQGPICEACPAGKYRSALDPNLCQDCDLPATNDAPASAVCLKCVTGYYLIGVDPLGHALCERCSSRYTTTLGPSFGYSDICRCKPGYSGFSYSCTECPPGSYKATVSVTSDLDMFLNGMSDPADACISCPENTQSEFGAQTSPDICEPCPLSSSAQGGAPSCSCNAGYYDNNPGVNAECEECPEGSFNEELGVIGVENCVLCPDIRHFAPVHSTNRTDCVCEVGYFGDFLSCQECDFNTYADDRGLAECIACPNNTITLRNGSTLEDDCRCPANTFGFFPAGESCTACPSNSSSAPDTPVIGGCICNEGYFGNLAQENASCGTCPKNEHPWISTFFCSCNAGYYEWVNGTDGTDGTDVTNGTDGTGNTNGTITPAERCQLCPPNSTSEVAQAGISSCFCLEGFYGNPGLGIECLACPAKASSPPGSRTIASCTCIAGFAGDPYSNVTCLECGANDQNSWSWKSSLNCTCNIGFFGTSLAATNQTCNACPTDTYNSLTGQRENSSCVACPEFAAAPNTSTSIFNCSCNAGYYRDLSGPEFFCPPCPNGTFSTEPGKTSLADCQLCPPLSSAPVASLTVSSCVCIAGYFGETAFDCAPCPNNTFNRIEGRTNISECLPCIANSSSGFGSTNCHCDEGFFGNPANDIPCVSCPMNTYQPFAGRLDQAACTQCPGNFSFSPNASTTCKCLMGYFGKPLDGMLCQSCGPHASSSAGSISRSQCGCIEGFYANLSDGNQTCVSCPANASSGFGSTVISDCQCAPGFFGDPSRNVSCHACPSNASSLFGAHFFSDCFCIEGTYGSPADNVTCRSCPSNSLSVANTSNLAGCICTPGFFGGSVMPTEPVCWVKGLLVNRSFINGSWTNGSWVMVNNCTVPSNTPSDGNLTNVNMTNVTYWSNGTQNGTNWWTWDGNLTNVNVTNVTNVTNWNMTNWNMTNVTNVTDVIETDDAVFAFCRSCPDGAVSAVGSTQQSDCTCGEGFYGDPTDGKSCRRCPQMSTSPVGSTNISNCYCESGYYGNPQKRVTCLPCPANSESPAGSSLKTNCSCNAGFYGDASVFNSTGACTQCPAGTYNPFTDQVSPSSCTRCPSNSSSVSASLAVSECSCNAGFFGLLGVDDTCTPCAVSTYNPNRGRTVSRACRRCPRNAITLLEASTSLADCLCDYGHYRSIIGGGVYCLQCPQNTYGASVGQTSLLDCSSCPRNSTALPGSRNYTDCTCNPGFERADDGFSCFPCPNNTYSPVAGSACTPCPPNSMVSGTGNTLCSCSAGYYGMTLSHQTCQECPAGTYSPGTGIRSITDCQSCPTGSASLSLATVTVSMCICVPGYYGESGGCTACTAGKFNTLFNQTTADACISCLGNTTSFAASTACGVLVNGTLVV